ncbi:MAG: hypothetical protein CL599_06195 [Alteromonas sp.]|nr:hypothetical protein [Alteromonas sp.]
MGELSTVLFASRVICVSSSVKDELDIRFPFFLQKRVVIRNAGSLNEEPIQINQEELLKEIGVAPQKYILAVGRLDATKGFDNLIDAYLALQSMEFKLVIVGDNYITNDFVTNITRHRSGSIIFAGAIIGANLAAIACSGPFRSSISVQTDQRFRSNPIAYFGVIRSKMTFFRNH